MWHCEHAARASASQGALSFLRKIHFQPSMRNQVCVPDAPWQVKVSSGRLIDNWGKGESKGTEGNSGEKVIRTHWQPEASVRGGAAPKNISVF